MEDPEQDIDAETLQAQINLSLAHTQNLVSSWLKPKYGSATAGSSRGNEEKELEELMKRPPRLGVGAPIPSSTGVAGHEAMKLKGKLTGKKRPREEEDQKSTVISDDEGESRAGAIKKKARQDPFAPKPKKSANTPAVIAAKPSSKATGKKPEASSKASPQRSLTREATPVPGPSTEGSQKTQPVRTTGAKADAPGSADESSEDDGSMDVDKPETPSPTATKEAEKLDSNGAPLLNLAGPPAVTSPPKKKRKRNKKKKKGVKAQA